MKGIVLAGGTGTRLHPVTIAVNKHLLPIYDKPMVHYPLSTLMLAGIRDVLIVTTPGDRPLFERLLGDGERLGIRIRYAQQARPEGIAQALIVGADFVGHDPVVLVLGDNVFYGHDLPGILQRAIAANEGATIFSYYVKDPSAYAVAEFDPNDRVIALHEKPASPPSNYAITGLYVYAGDVVLQARTIQPSDRGELEITDLNRRYLAEGRLRLERFGRGIAWLDTGTHAALVDAANFIATIERRQDLKVGCLEEIAFRMGFIGLDDLARLAEEGPRSETAEYLRKIVQSEKGAGQRTEDARVAGPERIADAASERAISGR